MSDQQYLLTLNVPVSLEEALVDCLLTLESKHGFSAFPVYAHDHKNIGLSLAEQVSGRQKKMRFQMYVPEQQLQQLLDKLKKNFKGAGILYWVLPVIEYGNI